MTEDFKKWLCEKAGMIYDLTLLYDDHPDFDEGILLQVLIEAMWAINREGKWNIEMTNNCIEVWKYQLVNSFEYEHHNNSEQESLAAALEYICRQENK